MKSNMLIVYYSWHGNTRKIAEQIKRETGGDLFEIKPAHTKQSPDKGLHGRCIVIDAAEQYGLVFQGDASIHKLAAGPGRLFCEFFSGD